MIEMCEFYKIIEHNAHILKISCHFKYSRDSFLLHAQQNFTPIIALTKNPKTNAHTKYPTAATTPTYPVLNDTRNIKSDVESCGLRIKAMTLTHMAIFANGIKAISQK